MEVRDASFLILLMWVTFVSHLEVDEELTAIPCARILHREACQLALHAGVHQSALAILDGHAQIPRKRRNMQEGVQPLTSRLRPCILPPWLLPDTFFSSCVSSVWNSMISLFSIQLTENSQLFLVMGGVRFHPFEVVV